MPRIPFTALSIKALKPTDTYVEYYAKGRDAGAGSFGIRVSPKGKMTWFVTYRGADKKQKRFKLGAYPDVSLKKARTALSALKIGDGGDPIAKAKKDKEDKERAKAAKDSRPTMSMLWKIYADDRESGKKALVTKIEEDRKWKSHVAPLFADMPVEDFTRKIIRNFLKDYAKKSPVAANRLHSFLSVLLTTAIDEEIIDIHPMYKLKKQPETARERVLSDEELKTLWALLENETDNTRYSMRMMLLTAQRKGEVFKMHWSDIKDDVWHQATNKTNSYNLVPLSPQAMKIINSNQRTCVSQWVFLSNRKDNCHIVGVKKARIRLNKLMGCEDNPWTEHDLRRTARTLLSRLNIQPDIRERVLNHAQDGMVKVYDQYDYLTEKRDALVKLANLLDEIVGNKPKPQGKVIKMQGAA